MHFVVHLPKGDQIPDVDTADLERRLTEASRSWRDDFIQAVIAEYGEEVGTILGRRYAESFPEAYKEDFSARTASVDLGRLEAIRTDGPHDGGLDLSLYEHLDAGPGEARLKVYRIGDPALALQGAADALLDGRRGRRRAALRARGARARSR